MKSSLLLTTLLTSTALSAPVTTTPSAPDKGLDRALNGLEISIKALFTSQFPSLVPRQTSPYATTANELTDGTTACRAVTLIWARGTNQDGNIGAIGDVGPLMMNNLSAIVGGDSLAVQGVDYSANILGFLGIKVGVDPKGAQTMADLVARANTQCPTTKIVMSGYSQGGQLVHEAALKLATNTAALAQVAAVVIFGDPDNGDAVGTIPADKVKIICHDGDNICAGGVFVLAPHKNYQIDALAGAEFVASMVK